MTILSLGGLTVLLIAFLSANMKAASGISSTIQSNVLKTTSTLSTVNVVNTELDPGMMDDHSLETNHTQPNVDDKENTTMWQNLNCSDTSSKKTCSTYFTTTPIKNIVTYRDFKEYEHYQNLVTVVPYVSNIPGMITNILTIIVATNIKPLHTSEIYMTAIGIADFVAVVTRCSFQVLNAHNGAISSNFCKVPQYIIHVTLVYSNIILMPWTIERFIAVIFPIKLATWCSVRNTKITVSFLLLISLLVGIPYLTDISVYRYWTGKVTVSVCFQTDFFNSVWTHTQSVYYIYIPVICVFTCNTAIICELSAMTKFRINMASNQKTIDRKTKENRKMTILLLTISISFLVLHIPYTAILVFYYFNPDPTVFISTDPHAFAKFIFYSTLGYLVTEYQNSVNFFLYCISGSKFRTTFKRMFCKVFMHLKQAGTSLSQATRSTQF